MKKSYGRLYKDNKEALDFIKANPELFKDVAHGPAFKMAKEKQTYQYEDTYLLGPKRRAVLQDILCGLSNEEIMQKYKFRTPQKVRRFVHIAKTILLRKLNSGSYLLKNKSIIKFDTFYDKRVFTYRNKTEEVFLVKVPDKFQLAYKIFDEDHVSALIKKAEVLVELMPYRIKRQWKYLTGKLIMAEHLQNRIDLLKFLNTYRWVDSKGTLFKPSVDILLSIDTQEMDLIEEQ